MHLVASGVVIPPPLLPLIPPTSAQITTRPPSFTLISASQNLSNGDLDAPSLSPYSQGVLESLMEFPAFEDLTTLVHVPKGCSRRWGVLCAASFWYQNIAMECSPDHQRFYSLLCYYTTHFPCSFYMMTERPVTSPAACLPRMHPLNWFAPGRESATDSHSLSKGIGTL